MKTTPAALVTHMQQPVTTMAGCWKLQRSDGTVLAFTDHDKDLVIDLITYKASSGFARTATRQTAGLNPDNLEIVGILADDAITEADLVAGRYRGCEVWYFEVNWSDLTMGKHKLDYGVIGEVTHTRNGFQAEFFGLVELLSNTVGRKYSRICSHTLGDANCGIELRPATWQASTAVVLLEACLASSYDGVRQVCTTAGTTGASEPTWSTTPGGTTSDGTAEWTCYPAYVLQGSVTATADTQSFVDITRVEADGYLNYGRLLWTGGLNSGIDRVVKESAADGSIMLHDTLPFDITIGDTYEVEIGCNHLLKMPGDVWGSPYTGDCRAKFNTEDGGNAKNYAGFPEQPGNDQLIKGPA